jgi:hypothetical protein
MDDYVRASINHVNGKHHPDTGHYGSLVINGLESKEEAAEYKRALHRSAYWLHKHAGLNCSMSAQVKKNTDKTYRIEYKVIDKDYARASMIERYGPDQENWPYSPHRFHKNFNTPSAEE